jgi:hypothetical protein
MSMPAAANLMHNTVLGALVEIGVGPDEIEGVGIIFRDRDIMLKGTAAAMPTTPMTGPQFEPALAGYRWRCGQAMREHQGGFPYFGPEGKLIEKVFGIEKLLQALWHKETERRACR